MKTIYKIYSITTSIITWSVIGCLLIAICTLFIPKLFGAVPYIVLSGSMEPEIHTGSLVYVSDTDDELKVGDIIGYDNGTPVPIIHRIIKRSDDGNYITKGDANKHADMNEVEPSQVLGKFILTIPNAGYILSGIRSHVFHFGAITVPAAIPVSAGTILLMNIIQYVVGLCLSDGQIKNKSKGDNHYE